MQNLQEKYKYTLFLEYSNELESIISKKAYSTDIANMLRLSFPVMIEYYGHEYKNVLFNVLKEINIEIPEDDKNMYDIVQKYTPPNIETKSQVSAVNDGELKRASGVHFSTPIFEIIDGKVTLVGKSEVVSVKKESDTLDTLATFVHELSHAFKSSQNSMNLLNDKDGNQILATRSGISVVYSKVYIENGTIVIDVIQEKNIGLEEGINTYDENNIINKILSLPTNEIPDSCQELKNSLKLLDSETEYASKGYVQETLCADKLLTKCKLGQAIRQDQFIGSNNCEQIYNSIVESPQNTWQNLNSKIDLSVKHTYDRYKNIFNPNWFEEHKAEIIGNLQDIHSMLDECTKNEKAILLEKNE